MWEQILNVVLSLGAPEVAILLLLIGGAIAYVARSRRGALTDASFNRESNR